MLPEKKLTRILTVIPEFSGLLPFYDSCKQTHTHLERRCAARCTSAAAGDFPLSPSDLCGSIIISDVCCRAPSYSVCGLMLENANGTERFPACSPAKVFIPSNVGKSSFTVD